MQRTPFKSKTLTDENPFSLSLGDLMAGLLLIFILLLSFVMLRLENLMEERRRQIQLLDEREQIKKSLIERLLKELADFDVEVDPDTGVIRIKEGILYDFGKDELKQAGKDFLRQFIPKYVQVLLSEPVVSEHIAQVIIEGHTDNVGSWDHNLDLSLRRANSVAAYLYTEEFEAFPHGEALKKILSANGRSFAQPIIPNKTEEKRAQNKTTVLWGELKEKNKTEEKRAQNSKLTLREWIAKYNDTEEKRTQNRRVEFQFRLRDWDLVSPKVEKILEIETDLSSP